MRKGWLQLFNKGTQSRLLLRGDPREQACNEVCRPMAHPRHAAASRAEDNLRLAYDYWFGNYVSRKLGFGPHKLPKRDL